ncbi:MAG: mycothiol system anti-sigma-R factor [Candidatus Nanopelagicales bacterium]|nr:mycothiol system anti-sigma-R factor [Candidatus Nanopelagicales bacterium]MDZ4249495.1 mycothiol system anti-sigma-R factor [Candidatus Nanopelagicales bacterium]
MNCSDTTDIDCGEVIDHVYEYLDGEMGSSETEAIKRHLVKCAHCYRQVGIEQMVCQLVMRSCAGGPAPAELKSKIITRITEFQATGATS